RLQEHQFLSSFFPLFQPLLKNFDLPGQALPQILTHCWFLQSLLQLRNPPFHLIDFFVSSIFLRARRFLDNSLDRLSRQQQADVNPPPPRQALVLFFQARRQRGRAGLLLHNALAAGLQRAVSLLVFLRKPPEQIVEPFLPPPALIQEPAAVNQISESGMRSQPAEIPELTSNANYPKSRIQNAEQTEHAEANPVRRYEHAYRTRVECSSHVIPEARLHGLLILLFAVLFSNTP